MRRWVGVVAFNLLFVATVCFGVEFAARRIVANRLGPRGAAPQTIRDRWTAWRNNPAYSRVDIVHNSQGFRHTEEVSRAKPPGTIRIFFLGGSAAYGCEGLLTMVDGSFVRLHNYQLIDHYLQERLSKKHTQFRWEVINSATNMYRIHQDAALIQSRLVPFSPDLIVTMDGYNDVSGLLGSNQVPYDPYETTQFGDEFQLLANPSTGRAVFFQLHSWLRNQSTAYFAMQRRFQRIGGTDFQIPKGPKREYSFPVSESVLTDEEKQWARDRVPQHTFFSKSCRKIAAVSREEGIPVVFALQPELNMTAKKMIGSEQRLKDYYIAYSGPYVMYMYGEVYPRIHADMAKNAADGKLNYVSLTGAFDQSNEQTFTDYCHLTPRGNELVAERLVGEVERVLAHKLDPAAARKP